MLFSFLCDVLLSDPLLHCYLIYFQMKNCPTLFAFAFLCDFSQCLLHDYQYSQKFSHIISKELNKIKNVRTFEIRKNLNLKQNKTDKKILLISVTLCLPKRWIELIPENNLREIMQYQNLYLIVQQHKIRQNFFFSKYSGAIATSNIKYPSTNITSGVHFFFLSFVGNKTRSNLFI